MPKEYITTESARRLQETNGGQEPSVKVSWDRVGYVQISTVLKGGIEQIHSGEIDVPRGSVDEGHYVDLDRESLNQLIRVLRRARDAAYGRDE